MKKLSIIFTVLSFLCFSVYSQNKSFKGRVISDFIETISFASIIIHDSVVVGKTDLYGFFKIDIPVSVKNILFLDVGADPTWIEPKDTCGEVEVIMMLSGTYDFISSKKVDRRRKKRFKKLPELHKRAFEEGLFKTDRACYGPEFVSYFF